MSKFDIKRVAQLKDAIEHACRDIKSVEELHLSTEGEDSRALLHAHRELHLKNNYNSGSAGRLRPEGRGGQHSTWSQGSEGQGVRFYSVCFSSPETRSAKGARRTTPSDSDDDDFVSDSKMLPRELPDPPDGYKETKTGTTHGFRTEQFHFMALVVFYIA